MCCESISIRMVLIDHYIKYPNSNDGFRLSLWYRYALVINTLCDSHSVVLSVECVIPDNVHMLDLKLQKNITIRV